jgi:hypothetical protein
MVGCAQFAVADEKKTRVIIHQRSQTNMSRDMDLGKSVEDVDARVIQGLTVLFSVKMIE